MSRREVSTLDGETYSEFAGSAAQFDLLAPAVGGGMPLGVTRGGRRVTIALLRPEPTRIVVVAEAWLASLVVIRAAVLGAATLIATGRPAPWNSLVRAVGGQQAFASVVPPEELVVPAASVASPVLVLHDATATATEASMGRAPWLTSMHLVSRLSEQLGSLLDATDLILLPRPDPAEIDGTLALLRLPPGLAEQLPRMTDVQFLAITRVRALFVTIAPTPTELSILGGR